ncbi:MAG: peptidylprolyl isomerase [Rikenellaceae bacterium]|nr:peptidylprolyl isomerase [Rikenellaceae bacterium]
MLKKSLLIIAAAVLCLSVAFAQKRQVMLDKVVAVVGASSILHSEVSEHARQLVEQRRAEGFTSDRDPMNEALEEIMTQKLLYHQGQIDSVHVSEGDILSRVEDQVQAMIAETGSIHELETAYHMPIFNIREMLQQRMREQAFAQSMRYEVESKVKIIPGEVEHFYKTTSKDSLPMIAEQYVYAHITKFPKSITEAKQRTKERLLDMRQRVISGQAKFANLARMYSEDGTAMRGGEMDPTPLSALDPAFADALEQMRIGQISEVVESQFGFHIIELMNKQGHLYHFRHIILKPSYTSEELSEALHTLDSLATLIRADSISFEQAALEHSDDKTSKMNGGIVSNQAILERYQAYDAKLTVTKFLREDFAQFGALDDYNRLIMMKPNDVSDSFLTADVMMNQLAKIVKLVKVIPTHQASLADDYLRLEEMALQAKKERVFNEWLTDKIEGMYVYIDPEFRNGEFENKHWVR